MWTLFSLLMACRPSIQLKITHPADVTIDPSVTKIAVVDRVANDFTKGAVQGFLEQSQEVDLVRFQVVSAQQIYNDLAVPVNGPIPNEAMNTLCQKAGVKGALVLHRFRNNDDLDVDRRTETRTVDGKQQTIDVYTATYRADLQADWRFRGCNGQTYDAFMSQNGATWSGEGDTPGDAKSNVGDTDKLALELADELGNAYFRRVSPSETYEYRKLYRGPFGKKGKRFRKAVDLTKEHRYVKARDVYQKNMDGFSNKVQGKALYNMAILHEAMGEYDRMVKKAERADGVLQSRKSERYLDYAKERRQDERKLKEQMKKAEQVNSQDNQ